MQEDAALVKVQRDPLPLGASKAQRATASLKSLWSRFVGHLVDLDAFGLLMFAAGWTCLLLPLTLVNGLKTTWKSHSIIAMLVCGPVILVAFIFYEAYYAKKPVFPLRLFKNKTIIAAALIGFFDFVSFCELFRAVRNRGSLADLPSLADLQFTYQYSFIAVVHSDWSVVNQGVSSCFARAASELCLTSLPPVLW